MRRYQPKTTLRDEDRERLDFTVSVFGPGMKEATRCAQAFKARWLRERGDRLVGGHAPMGAKDPRFLDLSLVEDPRKLPLVVGGAAFGELCGRAFVERHVRGATFAPAPAVPDPSRVAPLFEEVEITDPTGSYQVFGGSAFVMLVNERKLAGLPAPTSWEEVLDERYRGLVVTGFNIDDVNEIPLIYLYRLFGAAGLEALARNLAGLVDTLDMARTAIPGANPCAIYLVPYFFAAAMPKRPYLRIVWPREGAFFSPYYYLAQAGLPPHEHERARAIVQEFFLGPELAATLAGRDMFHLYGPCGSGPTIAPSGVAGRGDPVWNDRRLMWLGWDWLLNNGIIELMATIDAIMTPLLLERFPQLAADRGKNQWNG